MSTSLDAIETRPGPRRPGHGYARPVLIFLSIALALFVVMDASHASFGFGDPSNPELHDSFPGTETLVGPWLQYDSGWYVGIAAEGYDDANVAQFKAGQQSSVAFFPAYPLTVRAVDAVTGIGYPWSAQLTSTVAGLLATILLWTWLGSHVTPSVRRTTLLIVLLYPYAWFLFGTGYGDALFLASALGAFVLVERDHPVAAGLVAIVATAGRPNGVAVLVGLIGVILQRREVVTRDAAAPIEPGAGRIRRELSRWEVDASRLRPRDGGVLLAAGGLLAYAAYLWHRVGDPIAFATIQSAPGWDQGSGPHTWFKLAFLSRLVHEPTVGFTWRLIVEALIGLAFLAAIPVVGRRFGWGYGAYCIVIIGIPVLGSGDFQGFGRYMLVAFPVFAVGGELLADRDGRRWVLVASAVALFGLSALYARGYYLT